jgi:hypothetical protein
MSNVVPFPPTAANETEETSEARPKFSFDITQPDPRGFVLIDACVPLALAVTFMDLVTEYNGA